MNEGNKFRAGKLHSEETKKKMSNSRTGKIQSIETIKKRAEKQIGNKRALGKKWSEKSRKNISGENHRNWLGGYNKKDYGIEFNKELKELVKARDRKICQLCNSEPSQRLSVHHIDYNKKNNDEKNLISLCVSCHMRTNSRRDFWKEYFQNLQKFNYVLKEIFELKKRKSLDYGNSYKIMGIDGIMGQINNKIIRLWNLQSTNAEPQNESIKDTYKDLAVYALMAVELIQEGITEPNDKEMSKLFRRRFNKITE